jgi:hypothetical protein
MSRSKRPKPVFWFCITRQVGPLVRGELEVVAGTGRVCRIDPALGYMWGWSMDQLITHCADKGWLLEEVDRAENVHGSFRDRIRRLREQLLRPEEK